MQPDAQSSNPTSCFRLFQMLDATGQQRVLGAVEAVFFAAGATIIQEGEAGDALYVIVSGQAEVSVDDLGEEKILGLLGEGAIFGEMAIITTEPRSATVKAKDQVSALRIRKDVILAVLKDYPKVKEQIARIGVARAEDTLDKLTPPIPPE